MIEPSVEEIVRAYEAAKALGLPQNYLGREYADALIADWRKRGEALEGAKYAVECMMESNSVSLAQDTIIRIKAALTQQQPPG